MIALTGSSNLLENLGVQSNDERSCPPWFTMEESGSNCTCGKSLEGIITCQPGHGTGIKIKSCYCMTSEPFNATVLGACSYTCLGAHWSPDPLQLNYEMCTRRWKRTGRLCSQCIDGHGPLVYSYSMQCVPCSSDVIRDSILLFLTHFLLLTVFCLTIITLRISVARPPMSTFVLVCQVMSATEYLKFFLISDPSSAGISKDVHKYSWKFFAAFFGLWNLDILRSFYPQMCLGSNVTTLQAQFMEYGIALFPLVILLFIVVNVSLYNRGNRFIFCICRPIHSCLARFRRTIDTRNSVIDAFATFIILSMNKIGFASFNILQPVYVYSPTGNYSLFLYIDPSVKYFGWQHFPYAFGALVLTIVFILIPLLLLFLYPLKSFQNFLNKCQWQCSTLHIFADTFHGCYKNGTRDYRWFAGIHLLLRFSVVVPFQMAKYHQLALALLVISLSFYTVLLAVFQPYKKRVHLTQDVILLFALSLWNSAVLVGLMDIHKHDNGYDLYLHLIILMLSSSIPSLYICGLILTKVPAIGKRLRSVLCYGHQVRLLSEST